MPFFALLPMVLAVPSVTVPPIKAPVLDGLVSKGEYKGALTTNYKDATVYLGHDKEFLYLGIETTEPGIASVSILEQGKVKTLHASAALGTAIHGVTPAGLNLEQGFKWECREMSDEPWVKAERDSFFKKSGWLANSRDGESSTEHGREYRISRKLFGPKSRMLVAYDNTQDDQLVLILPKGAAYAKRFVQFVRGEDQEPIAFKFDEWALVKFAERKKTALP